MLATNFYNSSVSINDQPITAVAGDSGSRSRDINSSGLTLKKVLLTAATTAALFSDSAVAQSMRSATSTSAISTMPDSVGNNSIISNCTFVPEFNTTVGNWSDLINSEFHGNVDIADSVNVEDSIILNDIVSDGKSDIMWSTLDKAALGHNTEVFYVTSESELEIGPVSRIMISNFYRQTDFDKVIMGTDSKIFGCDIHGNVTLGNLAHIEDAEVYSVCDLGDNAFIRDPVYQNNGQTPERIIFSQGIIAGDNVHYHEVPAAIIDEHSELIEENGAIVARKFPELFHIIKTDSGYVVNPESPDSSSSDVGVTSAASRQGAVTWLSTVPLTALLMRGVGVL